MWTRNADAADDANAAAVGVIIIAAAPSASSANALGVAVASLSLWQQKKNLSSCKKSFASNDLREIALCELRVPKP